MSEDKYTEIMLESIKGIRERLASARKEAEAVGVEPIFGKYHRSQAIADVDTLLEIHDARTKLLNEALEELERSLADIGGCDHDTGICCCGLIYLIEALAVQVGQEREKSVTCFMYDMFYRAHQELKANAHKGDFWTWEAGPEDLACAIQRNADAMVAASDAGDADEIKQHMADILNYLMLGWKGLEENGDG